MLSPAIPGSRQGGSASPSSPPPRGRGPLYPHKTNDLERIEKSDYLEEALREAMLNASVHRDYSFSGSIIININDAGIRRIFRCCKDSPVQPESQVTNNTFKLILPNMNAAELLPQTKAPAAITPQMKVVLDYLAEYGEMTDEELQVLLNIKKTRAYLLTRQMSENGLIEIEGRGADKKYKRK